MYYLFLKDPFSDGKQTFQKPHAVCLMSGQNFNRGQNVSVGVCFYVFFRQFDKRSATTAEQT